MVTAKRRPLLASAQAIAVLREAFRTVRASRPFTMDAVVVLPDHLHCIWTLPPDDGDFATRWWSVKTWFTRRCDPALRATPDRARAAKAQQALWQHRYWEHLLRHEADFNRHVECIHYNPVKHGYAKAPMDWPHSSFRRYVEAGVYAADWGCVEMSFDGVGRECIRQGMSGYAALTRPTRADAGVWMADTQRAAGKADERKPKIPHGMD